MGRTVSYQGREYSVSDAHPAADVFPLGLDDPEFGDLVRDMTSAGYYRNRPVIRTPDGLVVDGRRRELAARVAGIEPVYHAVRWDHEEICEYVRREHLNRRNLTASQRAASVVMLAELMPAHRPAKGGNVAGLSQPAMAAAAGVGERTIRDAVKVRTDAPELMPAVRDGHLPASTAAKVADLSPADRQTVATAADPRAAAKGLLCAPTSDESGLSDADDEREEDADFGEDGEAEGDEDGNPATLPGCLSPPNPATLPGSGKRKRLPKGLKPGNKVDPDHPFADLLTGMSTFAAAVTRALKRPDHGEKLREYLTYCGFLLYRGEKYAHGEIIPAKVRFVGLKPFRRSIHLAGMPGKNLTKTELLEKLGDDE